METRLRRKRDGTPEALGWAVAETQRSCPDIQGAGARLVTGTPGGHAEQSGSAPGPRGGGGLCPPAQRGGGPGRVSVRVTAWPWPRTLSFRPLGAPSSSSRGPGVRGKRVPEKRRWEIFPDAPRQELSVAGSTLSWPGRGTLWEDSLLCCSGSWSDEGRVAPVPLGPRGWSVVEAGLCGGWSVVEAGLWWRLVSVEVGLWWRLVSVEAGLGGGWSQWRQVSVEAGLWWRLVSVEAGLCGGWSVVEVGLCGGPSVVEVGLCGGGSLWRRVSVEAGLWWRLVSVEVGLWWRLVCGGGWPLWRQVSVEAGLWWRLVSVEVGLWWRQVSVEVGLCGGCL
ncbi:uncharacterized protein LOC129404207 [Sorex araneus]|uniref:uncharacterized protein LOC129404207 n=1 Tax=Sorex araneus TaxID=42254 RepID=UPI0024335C7D|nr:uncharacterized protein LOC129404207 [Sorex araneus]